MKFNPQQFRQAFPIFLQPENLELVYLDNAATTQKPEVVIEAIADFYRRTNANAHRGSHRLAAQATQQLEETRQLLADFIGANKQEIVFTSGATDSLNLLATSLGHLLAHGDELLIGSAEHHANLVPWQLLAKDKGYKLEFFENSASTSSLKKVTEKLTDNTRVISVTAASNVTGFRNSIENLREIVGPDVIIIIDASQLLAHEPVNVAQLDCDFLFASAHKFYGPTGLGFLFGKKVRLDMLPIVRGGGEIVKDVSLRQSSFVSGPQRFEPGTSPLAAIAGLKACLFFWQQQNRESMREYEQALLKYCHERLQKFDDLKLLSAADNNVGICSFVFCKSGLSEFDLVQYLNEKDVAVRLGHLCAQPMINAQGLDAIVRISLAAYNRRQDIDILLEAINEFLSIQKYTESADAAKKTIGTLQSHVLGRKSEKIQLLGKATAWQQRYKMLMDWGRFFPVAEGIRQQENLVSGCESDAWLVFDQDKQCWLFDSDSRIVKGLFSLLEDIVNCHPEYSGDQVLQLYRELGLEKHLSESRSNGFRALLERVLRVKETGSSH